MCVELEITRHVGGGDAERNGGEVAPGRKKYRSCLVFPICPCTARSSSIMGKRAHWHISAAIQLTPFRQLCSHSGARCEL